MNTAIITGLVTLLGIISTYVAWRFNPRQTLYDKLDAIYKEEDRLREQRDIALQTNSGDDLTAILFNLLQLRKEKAKFLQRLRQVDGK